MTQTTSITFSLFDAYKNGNILEKLCQFRYQGFVVEEGYEIPTYNDTEFDQYDNPFARYITIMQGDEIVACSRINRTDIPYMAKDCWNHLIPSKFLPNDANFYECTRQHVSSKLETVERMKMSRIISAATYFALLESKANGVCYVAHSALFRTAEKLGMNPKSVARIDLPNFPNLHFLHIGVNNENASVVAKNLLEITGFDITQFFKI